MGSLSHSNSDSELERSVSSSSKAESDDNISAREVRVRGSGLDDEAFVCISIAIICGKKSITHEACSSGAQYMKVEGLVKSTIAGVGSSRPEVI